jgi:hypothetical protein
MMMVEELHGRLRFMRHYKASRVYLALWSGSSILLGGRAVAMQQLQTKPNYVYKDYNNPGQLGLLCEPRQERMN